MQLFFQNRSRVARLAKIPNIFGLRNIVVELIALLMYVRDVERCRSQTILPIQLAFPNLTSWSHGFIALQATVASIRFSVSTLEIHQKNERALRKLASGGVSISGVDNIEAAIARGKGVLLAYSNFSTYYFALLALGIFRSEHAANFFIVQPRIGPEATAILEKIRSIASPITIEHIQARTARSGVEILAALREGGVVACPIDNLEPGSPALFSNFLDRETPYPAGIFGIAAKTGSSVIPMHVEIIGNKYRVVLGKQVFPDENGVLENEMQKSIDHVAAHFSQVVRRIPGQWDSWRTLNYRWEFLG